MTKRQTLNGKTMRKIINTIKTYESALFLVACLVLAYPFKCVWNYAAVSACSVINPINYWMAFWLLFTFMYLASILNKIFNEPLS